MRWILDKSAVFLVTLVLASTIEGLSFPRPSDNSIHRRELSEKCKFTVKTDLWTTCGDLIDNYHVTLPDFYHMNPDVNRDCSNFRPGHTYCMRFISSYSVSEDGSCGHGTNVTCIGSKFGDCCGRNGKCGSDDEHCAVGYCQDGYCPGLGYSTDGRCGKQNNGLYCGGEFGECCSNDGKCGSTAAECGSGNCQSGNCQGTLSSSSGPSTAISTSTSMPQPSHTPFSPSPDGSCGYKNQYVCNGTDVYYGYCCSAAGYCGTDQWHCDNLQGCQSQFGMCDETVVETKTLSATSNPTAK